MDHATFPGKVGLPSSPDTPLRCVAPELDGYSNFAASLGYRFPLMWSRRFVSPVRILGVFARSHGLRFPLDRCGVRRTAMRTEEVFGPMRQRPRVCHSTGQGVAGNVNPKGPETSDSPTPPDVRRSICTHFLASP